MMTKHFSHSSDVMNDSRNFMWNQDFLELMSKRWQLNNVSHVLDVGCGIGHWGRYLAPFLAPNAMIEGIDPEQTWLAQAQVIAKKQKLNVIFKYKSGLIEKIPFPDNNFDMVTCQTVLIHISDIATAISEMIRVLKPGGLLAIVEPINSGFAFDSITLNWSIEKIIQAFKNQLLLAKGKASLGNGNKMIASVIPKYLLSAEIHDIQIYINDLACSFLPPYSTAREQAFIKTLSNITEFFNSSKNTNLEYYLAGGGTEPEFNQLWGNAKVDYQSKVELINKKEYYYIGNAGMYLISGRK